jgi:molybdopterin molybdotransferase
LQSTERTLHHFETVRKGPTMPARGIATGSSGTTLSPARHGAGQRGTEWSKARQLAFDFPVPLPPVGVPLALASGRTLARDVAAQQDLPHYSSSAMDGWAVNGSGPWALSEERRTLSPDHASTIATGGLVPIGATSILRKESGQIIQDADGKLLLALNDLAQDGEPHLGQHIRHAGEEAAAGEVLIPAGTVLNPAHIALAAVAGYDELQIDAKPLVAIVLTGAEVVSAGIPAPGQVRDTFGPQLGTVISLLGGIPENPHRIGDSYDEWLSALGNSEARPGEQPDVIITTGGTGPSGTDHLRGAVAALGGRLLLDGIAMRPGHPAVLAELPDGRFVVGLPGNPLAAMMALTTLAEPLLAALGNRSLRAVGEAISGADIDPDRHRTRLIPCRIIHGLAFPILHTGSGMMRGLAWADGIIVVPPGGALAGETVPVLHLPWST